jgi:hypothetical protein
LRYRDRAVRCLGRLAIAVFLYLAVGCPAFASHGELRMSGVAENIHEVDVYNEGEGPFSFYERLHGFISHNRWPFYVVYILGRDFAKPAPDWGPLCPHL